MTGIKEIDDIIIDEVDELQNGHAARDLLGNAGWYIIDDELFYTEEDAIPESKRVKQKDLDKKLKVLKSNQKVDKYNKTHTKYLADTDWYVTRKFETGQEIPEDVVAGRASARVKVVHVDNKTGKVKK